MRPSNQGLRFQLPASPTPPGPKPPLPPGPKMRVRLYEGRRQVTMFNSEGRPVSRTTEFSHPPNLATVLWLEHPIVQ